MLNTPTILSSAIAAFAFSLGLNAHAADAIKVGVVTPLSGSYAPIGKQVRWGAELAVKEINAAGGVNGRKFELVFEDEEANPPVAVRKAEKLLLQDKVDLLTGTVNSGSTLAVGQVAERNDRILVTTVSYATSITGAQCNANVFRVNANAFQQSSALTAWLVKNIPGKRYFFVGPDYEMGRSTIAAFQDDIKRLGGTEVGATYPPLGAKDFSPYLGQVRAARPDGKHDLGDAPRHEEDPQGGSSGRRRHASRQGGRLELQDGRQGAGRRGDRSQQLQEVLTQYHSRPR